MENCSSAPSTFCRAGTKESNSRTLTSCAVPQSSASAALPRPSASLAHNGQRRAAWPASLFRILSPSRSRDDEKYHLDLRGPRTAFMHFPLPLGRTFLCFFGFRIPLKHRRAKKKKTDETGRMRPKNDLTGNITFSRSTSFEFCELRELVKRATQIKGSP